MEADPKPLTAEELAEIEKRTDAATPGPWETTDTHGDWKFTVVRRGRVGSDCQDIRAGNEPDASFIAASRTDIPRLLATIRADRATIAARDAEIGRLKGDCSCLHDEIRRLRERIEGLNVAIYEATRGEA